MRIFRKRLQALLLVIVPSLLLGAETADLQKLVTPAPHYGRVARLLARAIQREHLTRAPLDNTIARKALDRYLASLDYDRVYFLNDDIERFNAHVFELDDQLLDGELTFAYAVFETLKQRVRDRTTFVKEQLEKGFDFETQENYRWKRKKEPWAATTDDWDDLWRKRIKNEHLRIVIDRELRAEEAAKATNAPPEVVSTSSDEPTKAPVQDAPEAVEPSLEPAPSEITTAEEGSDAETEIADDDTEETPNPDLKLSPEELIFKRYEQFLTTLEDSEAEWVLQKYLSAFTAAYDPHCDYMSPANVEDFDIEMRLSLVGIGAMLRPEDGAAKIVSVLPGGPAGRDKSKNRLREGDKIIAVAQGKDEPVSILHWPLNKAVRLIRGEKGSTVVLTVIPASDPTGTTTRLVTLVRDEVKLEEREAKSVMHTLTRPDGERSIGVIDLPAFYADLKKRRTDPNAKSSTRDVARLLRQLQDDGADGIILDLRNNGGGSLLEARDMTGLFISSGPTVQVRNSKATQILPDTDPNIAYNGPLIVLVNRLSASASEILAGALQDYGRAIIMGDSRTHGKGSVQTILPLSRDQRMGSLKVTSALFYRISGGSTQLRGVRPDLLIPSPLEYMDLGEDKLPNALDWSSVSPVTYAPYADMTKVIPSLRERSTQRRATDERYQNYTRLLKRVETFNATATLPLNLTARKSKAREERELYAMQDKLLEETSGSKNDDEDSLNGDIVLRESLEVIGDMLELDHLVQRYPGTRGLTRNVTPLQLFGQ
jgi:carboxyl-terminal processing protease